jgi:hypothetical protein
MSASAVWATHSAGKHHVSRDHGGGGPADPDEITSTGRERLFLAYSPERIDLGNLNYTTGSIPKIVGGITPHCTELATLLYQQFVEKVVPVSSTETA